MTTQPSSTAIRSTTPSAASPRKYDVARGVTSRSRSSRCPPRRPSTMLGVGGLPNTLTFTATVPPPGTTRSRSVGPPETMRISARRSNSNAPDNSRSPGTTRTSSPDHHPAPSSSGYKLKYNFVLKLVRDHSRMCVHSGGHLPGSKSVPRPARYRQRPTERFPCRSRARQVGRPQVQSRFRTIRAPSGHAGSATSYLRASNHSRSRSSATASPTG